MNSKPVEETALSERRSILTESWRAIVLIITSAATVLLFSWVPDPTVGYVTSLQHLRILTTPFASDSAMLAGLDSVYSKSTPPITYDYSMKVKTLVGSQLAAQYTGRALFERLQVTETLRYDRPYLVHINGLDRMTRAPLAHLTELVLADHVVMAIALPLAADVVACIDSARTRTNDSLRLVVRAERAWPSGITMWCDAENSSGVPVALRRCAMDTMYVGVPPLLWDVLTPKLRELIASGAFFPVDWDICSNLDSQQAAALLNRSLQSSRKGIELFGVTVPRGVALAASGGLLIVLELFLLVALRALGRRTCRQGGGWIIWSEMGSDRLVAALVVTAVMVLPVSALVGIHGKLAESIAQSVVGVLSVVVCGSIGAMNCVKLFYESKRFR